MNERLIETEEEHLQAMQALAFRLKLTLWRYPNGTVVFQVEAQMEASEIKDECSGSVPPCQLVENTEKLGAEVRCSTPTMCC